MCRPGSGRPGGRPLRASTVKCSVGAAAHIGPAAPALKISVGRDAHIAPHGRRRGFPRPARPARRRGGTDRRTGDVGHWLAMTGFLQGVLCAAGHTGPALQKYFAKQGPCALPWVRERNPPVTALPCQPPLGRGPWGRGCGLPQPVTQYRKCVERNDVGIGPYEVFTDRIS